MLGAMLVMPALASFLFRDRLAGRITPPEECSFPPSVNQ